MRIIYEPEFHCRLLEVLAEADTSDIGAITGPGRSGAIAAVYASHALGVPYISCGADVPSHLGRILVIDTARNTGRTLRKMARNFSDPLVLACFEEPPRIAFWYEATRPQFTFPPRPCVPTCIAVFCNGAPA